MAANHLEEHQLWKDLPKKTKRGVLALTENLTVRDGVAFSQEGADVSHIVDIRLKTTEAQVYGLNMVGSLAQHEEENGGFVFAFFNARKTMDCAFPTLSPSELGRLMFIATYTGWKTGVLKYDNGVSITKKGLQELLKMSRSRFTEFYKRLIDAEIIRESNDSLCINPNYFYRGEKKELSSVFKSRSHTRLFRDTVRDLYSRYNGRNIKHLALIYSVLPFVNFHFNILAYNPEEATADYVEPITLDKLSALLGYQKASTLSTAMNAVKLDGKPVFGFFQTDDRRAKKVVLNPRVVYSGNGNHLEAIKALFN
ncbi:hypothetical protein [Heyndrickxia acidicola]|uniref:Uncharacterized protein n=1 Tax=Heyndrickxia acidicola TaxID=209389 RepID=A0ABU6MDR0_9BACI|nr:hypothetical protein [Heyndrickxia acidicola]MED1202569.1 hypothetical protein [Heyndrickxia acidicola]